MVSSGKESRHAMNPAYRGYLLSMLAGYPQDGAAASIRRFIDWLDDPGRGWNGRDPAPRQPSWDEYGDAMGCYAPGALDEECIRDMGADPSRIPDVAGLLGDWAARVWDSVSGADVLGDTFVEALEAQGIHDPETVALDAAVNADHATSVSLDPADPSCLLDGSASATVLR